MKINKSSLRKKQKSLEALAREQRVKPFNFDDRFGSARHLWKSDREFEEFVAGIRRRRREG